MRVTREELKKMISNNEDVTKVDTSEITDMSYMFKNAYTFNQDISSWDVSSVTDMSGIFWDATAFNKDISNWDVSKVTNMSGMFWNTRSFNQDISNWNTSKVTYMSSMFWNAYSFNQPVNNWDVSNVEYAKGMLKDSPLETDIYEFKSGHVLIDGIICKKLKKINNILVLEDRKGERLYAVTNGLGVWAHGRTAEGARRDLMFKLSDRDTTKYKKLNKDSVLTLEEAVLCYREVTGACSLGVEYFLENGNYNRELYSIGEILELTRGQYGGETFARFFREEANPSSREKI